MMNQIGVRGCNLVGGHFKYYDITVNNQTMAIVAYDDDCKWNWKTDNNIMTDFDSAQEAMKSVKGYLREGGK